jgi:hypothetical protein
MSLLDALSANTYNQLRICNGKSACDKVSSGVGIVPFGSLRSRNQVSFGENMGIAQSEADLPDATQRCHLADVYQPVNGG